MQAGITKKQSSILYGIAIFLMIYHHTLGFPERLCSDYFSVLGVEVNYLGISLEMAIASFGKMCVAIFAFLTGYGFARKLDFISENPYKNVLNSYLIVIKKILSLLFKLLIVLAIFVPLYYFVNNRTVTFLEFIKNLFGISSSLNGEWWYVNFYFGICFLLPLLNQIFYKGYSNKRAQIIWIFVCSSLIILWYVFGVIYVPNTDYSIIVLEGYLVSRFKIFEFVNKKTSLLFRKTISVIILPICVALSIIFRSGTTDACIIIPFIFSVLTLIPENSKGANFFSFFGKHSTYMWLTHTFFEYYIFGKFIMFSKVSTIILVQTILVSLIASMILIHIEKMLLKGFKAIPKKIKKKNATIS